MTKLFSAKQAQLPSTLNLGDIFYANDSQRTYIGSVANVPVEITATTIVLPAPSGTLPVSGPQGDTGPQGPSVTGPQGPTGAQGETGATGVAGRSIVITGEWNFALQYLVGDLTTDSDGNAYLCIAQNSNNPPPNSAYWLLLGGVTVAGVAADIAAGVADAEGFKPCRL